MHFHNSFTTYYQSILNWNHTKIITSRTNNKRTIPFINHQTQPKKHGISQIKARKRMRTCWARGPEELSSSRTRSPVAMWGTPRSCESRLAYVPLPTPGQPRKTHWTFLSPRSLVSTNVTEEPIFGPAASPAGYITLDSGATVDMPLAAVAVARRKRLRAAMDVDGGEESEIWRSPRVWEKGDF